MLQENGNWWLQVQDLVLGYWPGSIFKYLASSATKLVGVERFTTWNRMVITQGLKWEAVISAMKAVEKQVFFRNIEYTDNSGKFRDVEPQSLNTLATRPSCYNVKVENNTNGGYGTHFYFGGPGYSTQCAK